MFDYEYHLVLDTFMHYLLIDPVLLFRCTEMKLNVPKPGLFPDSGTLHCFYYTLIYVSIYKEIQATCCPVHWFETN